MVEAQDNVTRFMSIVNILRIVFFKDDDDTLLPLVGLN